MMILVNIQPLLYKILCPVYNFLQQLNELVTIEYLSHSE